MDARNGLESYLYNLKNSLEGDNGSISTDDKKELYDLVDETLDWLETAPEAVKEDFDTKQKVVEQVANLLIVTDL